MNVLTRNQGTFTKLCQQAGEMLNSLETLPDFTKAQVKTLSHELGKAMAQYTEDDKVKAGMKAMQGFIANVEGQVMTHCNNAPKKFLQTQEWFAVRGASKHLLDQFSSGINHFIKRIRVANSLDDKISAYIEMKALVVKVQAEFFEEQKAAKPLKFAGHPRKITAADVPQYLRQAS